MNWTGKTVFISGGTGSFGRAFTRLLLETESVAAIRIFGRDEWKHAQMRHEFSDERIKYLVGDVRDADRVFLALDGVDVVIHAAALKRIEICERDPEEAVKTNIGGTINLLRAARERGVPRFLALSTDKAAQPLNLYGMTKAVLERIVVNWNLYSGPHESRFAVVRYGNVAGSRGSIAPIFEAQVREGRPITLTAVGMNRFWVTLHESARLVKRFVEEMRGTEIFVPKLPSVWVSDVARAIGGEQYPTRLVGQRGAEKTEEVLLTLEESRHCLDRGDHYVIYPESEELRRWPVVLDKPAPFVYDSASNSHWLTVEEIRNSLDLGQSAA